MFHFHKLGLMFIRRVSSAFLRYDVFFFGCWRKDASRAVRGIHNWGISFGRKKETTIFGNASATGANVDERQWGRCRKGEPARNICSLKDPLKTYTPFLQNGVNRNPVQKGAPIFVALQSQLPFALCARRCALFKKCRQF